MRPEFAIFLLIVAVFGAGRSLFANSRVPDLQADAFGHQYDELFNNTIVYAQVGWLQLFYRYSGDMPAQPPPGWIRLDTKPDDMSGTNRILFRLNNDDVIQSQGYPYFAITLEQARRIANSPQAVAIAVQEATPQKAKRVVETPLSPDQRKLIGQLADHGKEWKSTDKPWEIGGATALVVDLRPAVGERLEQIKSLLVKEIERREQSKDPFLLVRTGLEYPVRSPAVRGTAHYDPATSYYKPEEPRKFVKEMSALADGKGNSLGQMAAVVKNQQLQSMVVFLPDGPPLTDSDRIEEELREQSCRIFVVWLGEAESRSERSEQLKALAFRTRGGFVSLSPADGSDGKSP